MKRRIVVGILAILLAVLVLVRLSDTAISVADTKISADEITTDQTQASNCPASGTIAITMYNGDE